MSRKAKVRRTSKKPAAAPRWRQWCDRKLRRFVLTALPCAGVLAVVVTGAVAMRRLEGHVNTQLLARFPNPQLVIEVPECLTGKADEELSAVLLPLLELKWTDERLCRAMATRAADVGWVKRVKYVRRLGDGRFEVRCVYRLPFVMIQKDGEFVLVDNEGVRLPGTYRYDPSLLLVQGVAHAAPDEGEKWEGEDVAAALSVAARLRGEPFVGQITGIRVNNYGGRVDQRGSHIELATDRAGGLIRWGSAPGMELEENDVDRKIAILREVYRRTGRVDANHAVIDVSVFPDRYIVVE